MRCILNSRVPSIKALLVRNPPRGQAIPGAGKVRPRGDSRETFQQLIAKVYVPLRSGPLPLAGTCHEPTDPNYLIVPAPVSPSPGSGVFTPMAGTCHFCGTYLPYGTYLPRVERRSNSQWQVPFVKGKGQPSTRT